MDFRVSFGVAELEQWSDLMNRLDTIDFVADKEEDIVSWGLEKHGQFTTQSLYRQMTFGGVINTRMMNIWKSI